MQRANRGRALIINNEYISLDHWMREGSYFDVLNMCELLKALHFETVVKENFSAEVTAIFLSLSSLLII